MANLKDLRNIVKDDYYKLKKLKQRIVSEKSTIGFKTKNNG